MNEHFSCRYANVTRTRIHPDASVVRLHDEMSDISRMRSGAYDQALDVIRLPLDPHVLIEAKRVAERYYTSRLKYIILIGIGGQNLGVKAVYDALRGQLDLSTKNLPKVIFLDTLSSHYLHDLEELLAQDIRSSDEILISLSSKSGATTEVVANFEILMGRIRKFIPGVDKRVVVTSDHGSPLWISAHERGYGQLAMPKHVGGRYSIFSLAGIFPLLLAGIDVVELQRGAQFMLLKNFGNNRDEQFARHNAEVIFGEMQKGVTILNIFHFHPELESLGKWERQLIAESLGKEHDRSGKVVRTGITPIVTIGSTDLHSMAQLYFGGPKDKFTMLVRGAVPSSLRVPGDLMLGELVPGLRGCSPDDIMSAIYGGVAGAYRNLQLPFAEVELPALSAYALGVYLEWRILSTIYLAELLHINPFDQPSVEQYKEGTRKLLGSSHAKFK